MHFSELNIIEPILKAIKEEGYTQATPIQTQAIPQLLAGHDVLGCAQTGTGKTAAFSIPILQMLSKHGTEKGKRNIKSLILTPTRELAIQIEDSLNAYGRHLHLRSAVIFGGVNQNKQTNALAGGVDILVATPGRLLDLINQGFIRLNSIEFFVLDEADRMLDMGFIHDVNKILKLLPPKRQNLFFSATMAPEILKLAGAILRNPVKVEVTPVSSTVEKITQSVYFVDRANKNTLLVDVLNDSVAENVLVFSRTKHGCDKIVRHISKHGIKSDAIHGNKSQNNRQRALGNFKSKAIRVLVATDIAARGIDIEGMELVINYDLPNVPETYVHRIGRTGRAGNEGQAISFSDFEEKAFLKDIEKLTRQQIPVIDNHPYPMEVFEIAKKMERPSRHHALKNTNSIKRNNVTDQKATPSKTGKKS
ncbi:DEAD/DEAH box helicase [Niabella ginsengisoli]|uniref:DEAD/DEAH box helicase n=1 Tax=Niabella ginsengisoli TaxID=522298 RepID=A0ABS9SJD8_9BACT|nr:DEAD/DEAH box helicase [Niabella ginsengisoli]MCH5598471.1 DEAD/DEAH box helicase [Niabella ginsengisoli]